MNALFGRASVPSGGLTRHFRRLFRYDLWAEGEFVDRLYKSWQPEARAERLMCHIVAAKALWYRRITRDSATIEVWPTLSRDELIVQANVNTLHWHSLLEDLSDEMISMRVEYRNTKGEAWTSTVQDILTHVTMHSAYHRGQIAADLRANGHEPPYTDYIEAVRRGYVV